MFNKATTWGICLFCLLNINANAEVHDGIGKSFSHENQPAAAQPGMMNHPGMSASDGQTGFMQPTGPVEQAKVLEVINAAGYSYLLVESNGKKFWIAGTQVDSKAGDVVSYIENVVMENFTSKTLNKTFDRIIFASSVKVVP